MKRGDKVSFYGERKVYHRAAFEEGVYFATLCGRWADKILPDDTTLVPCKVCEKAWQRGLCGDRLADTSK
uniref:Uncharacterized protein n=1 Tax=viral metagenome TaxID=1070528 RepID=A0A6M3JDX4_9ZZZZ